MAHRGRLNVLANVMEKNVREIFAAFDDEKPERFLGARRREVPPRLLDRPRDDVGRPQVHLTLAFNPSHLEFVNPVVEGRVRAKQDRAQAQERDAAPHPRRRGVHGPGRRRRDAEPRGPRGLLDRRHHPRRRQQPDRLHDGPAGLALDALLHRHHAHAEGPRVPRERRGSARRSSRSRASRSSSASASARTSSSTCTATAATATTRATSRASRSRSCTRSSTRSRRCARSTCARLVETGQVTRRGGRRRSRKSGGRRSTRALEEVRKGDFSAAAGGDGRRLDAVRRRPRRGRPGGADTAFRSEKLLDALDEARDAARRASTRTRRSLKHPRAAPRARRRRASRSTGAPARSSRTRRSSPRGTPIRISGQDARRGTFSHRHAVALRHRDGRAATRRSSQPRRRRRRPLRGLRQPALRGGRARLRVRLQPRLPRRARRSGRRSSATSRTARRSSSISSSSRRRTSGSASPASCCSCRTATRARGRSTRARASSASSSSRRRTTSRSAT